MLADTQTAYNLAVRQGETFYQEFQWAFEGTTPVNLTSMTSRGQIRSSASHAGVICAITIAIIDAANGIFALKLTAAETKSIPTTGDAYDEAETYVYDVEFTDSAGAVYRVLQGYVTVSPEVTK
ncbi:hypothetical protein [Anaeromusa sp.]|uniref:hypothetical protein n=1 Tax=Anaeromusa sp. TaxID=1872520 RepID=UPI00260741C5|nr:hypothetical protein [Anaeromusa sp.]MDD3157657.1 hypothetical protein [Anaeromusa sp.]